MTSGADALLREGFLHCRKSEAEWRPTRATDRSPPRICRSSLSPSLLVQFQACRGPRWFSTKRQALYAPSSAQANSRDYAQRKSGSNQESHSSSADKLTVGDSAASAAATLLLADPSSSCLLLFGSGTQAYYHARLISDLFPINEIAVVVRSENERAVALIERLEKEGRVTTRLALAHDEVQAAVQKADIICT